MGSVPSPAATSHRVAKHSHALEISAERVNQSPARTRLTQHTFIHFLFLYWWEQHLEAVTGSSGKTGFGFSARSKRARQVRHGFLAPQLHPGNMRDEPGWWSGASSAGGDELLMASSAHACQPCLTLPLISLPSAGVLVLLSPCGTVPWWRQELEDIVVQQVPVTGLYSEWSLVPPWSDFHATNETCTLVLQPFPVLRALLTNNFVQCVLKVLVTSTVLPNSCFFLVWQGASHSGEKIIVWLNSWSIFYPMIVSLFENWWSISYIQDHQV